MNSLTHLFQQIKQISEIRLEKMLDYQDQTLGYTSSLAFAQGNRDRVLLNSIVYIVNSTILL